MEKTIKFVLAFYLISVTFFSVFGSIECVKEVSKNIYFLSNSLVISVLAFSYYNKVSIIALKTPANRLKKRYMLDKSMSSSVGWYNVLLSIFNIVCILPLGNTELLIGNYLLNGLGIISIFVIVIISTYGRLDKR